MPFRSPSRDHVNAARIGITLQARIVPDPEPAWPFSLTAAPGTVVVRGQVSAGHSGWVLSATVLRRRRKLMLQIGARRLNGVLVPDIEQHEYEVTLTGVGPGQYDVYVAHTFYTEGYATAFPDPRYLGGVTVTAVDAAERTAPLALVVFLLNEMFASLAQRMG